MLSKIKGFVGRHKKKFIFGGVVIAGGLLLKYGQRKLIEYQEKQVKEFLDRTRRSQHFESTEKTTDLAIIGLIPALCESIIKILNTESILAELKTNCKGNRKIELWEELKILSFARCTAFVYAISLLVTSLRVQLNIIGGYLYKDALQSTEKITKEIQTIYSLVLIQHLMGSGLNQLVKIIRENVVKVMRNQSLKEKLMLNDVEQLFWSIQHSVDKDINKNLIQFILPAETQHNQQDELLNKMLADSMDVFECGEYLETCESSINNAFTVVIDNVADFYVEPVNGKNKLNDCEPTTSKDTPEKETMNNNSHVNINSVSLPLAKIIPILNALTSQVPSTNAADNKSNFASSITVLQTTNQNIKTLGANVYEVYSH
ncbi:peroxisomal biogenesis factor 3 [Chironomus tepperi]|uniref:peroxisomal biogenesis factor 3 n=1 Tax=Chironomus tepperi TaxID=113505 RepID=UPI00391F5EC0